jgi:hypothetical protein
MTRLMCNLILLFVSMSILGCHPNVQLIGAHDKDVTEFEKYWGGYVLNHEYKTKVDLFLKDVLQGNETFAAVVAANSCKEGGLYSSPGTVTEYLDNTNRWPTVRGVIEQGTRIKCTMIRRKGTWLWPESISVWGQIITGPHEGVVANLNDISNYGENHNTYSPDERFLEK